MLRACDSPANAASRFFSVWVPEYFVAIVFVCFRVCESIFRLRTAKIQIKFVIAKKKSYICELNLSRLCEVDMLTGLYDYRTMNKIIFTLLISLPLWGGQGRGSLFAQDDWVPMDEFPLLYPRMQKATIHYGMFTESTKVAPCNIHIGTADKEHTLYYINDDGTLMETSPVNVRKVEFQDGVYVPVSAGLFGKIVHEDSVGKVIRVWDLDREKLKAHKLTTHSSTERVDLKMKTWYVPDKSDYELPMKVVYYFNFRGEIFEISEKNILSHIDQKRRREYMAFTRSAEIISTNESSVMKIWREFFVKY